MNYRTYTADNDALHWQDTEGLSGKIEYKDVVNVNAKFHPTRFQPNRYIICLKYIPNNQLIISNTTYKSLGDFEELNDMYAPFAQELNRKIALSNPTVEFKKGSGFGMYMFSILMVFFLIAIVILAGIFFVLFGLFWVTIIKVGILIYYFPSLLRYIRRNKPAHYDPFKMPADTLP